MLETKLKILAFLVAFPAPVSTMGAVDSFHGALAAEELSVLDVSFQDMSFTEGDCK